jgi:hypothetical protein
MGLDIVHGIPERGDGMIMLRSRNRLGNLVAEHGA